MNSALQVKADNLMLKLEGEDRQTLLSILWDWRKCQARLDLIAMAVRAAD